MVTFLKQKEHPFQGAPLAPTATTLWKITGGKKRFRDHSQTQSSTDWEMLNWRHEAKEVPEQFPLQKNLIEDLLKPTKLVTWKQACRASQWHTSTALWQIRIRSLCRQYTVGREGFFSTVPDNFLIVHCIKPCGFASEQDTESSLPVFYFCLLISIKTYKQHWARGRPQTASPSRHPAPRVPCWDMQLLSAIRELQRAELKNEDPNVNLSHGTDLYLECFSLHKLLKPRLLP